MVSKREWGGAGGGGWCCYWGADVASGAFGRRVDAGAGLKWSGAGGAARREGRVSGRRSR